MNPIRHILVAVSILLTFTVAGGSTVWGGTNSVKSLENSDRLVTSLHQYLLVAQKDVRDVKVIRIVADGTDKGFILFEFTADNHQGKPVRRLAIGNVAQTNSEWQIVGVGSGDENPNVPFTLGWGTLNDQPWVYCGVINDSQISRISIEMNGSEVNAPIINNGGKRYFYAEIRHHELYVDAVRGLNAEGKEVYKYTMNHE